MNVDGGRFLGDLSIKKEQSKIEDSKFFLERKFTEKLLHDDYYDEGFILNLKKGG